MEITHENKPCSTLDLETLTIVLKHVGPSSTGGLIGLEIDRTHFLSVLKAQGTYYLIYRDGGIPRKAETPPSYELVEAICRSYFAQDSAWRSAVSWVSDVESIDSPRVRTKATEPAHKLFPENAPSPENDSLEAIRQAQIIQTNLTGHKIAENFLGDLG